MKVLLLLMTWAILHCALDARADELPPVCEELPWEQSETPANEPQWSDMVADVVDVWNIFFQLDGASPADRRRDNFERFAEHVADYVTYFQNPVVGSIGWLPKVRSAHLIVAVIILGESSVTPSAEGKKGEIGLMQLMPGAKFEGVAPAIVARHPQLQILLGVKYLAEQVALCYPDGVDDWTDADWLGPLSAYAGGGNGYDARARRCKEFGVMKKRLKAMKLYRLLIDTEGEPNGR